MVYLWLKGLHVAAVLVWIGGMLIMPALIERLARLPEPERTDMARRLRSLFRWTTNPAITIVWLLGIAMIVEGAWLGQPWMWLKLLLATLLGTLHGLVAGWLRRLATGIPVALPGWVGLLLPAQVCGLLGIALLVVLKPQWAG